MTALPLSITLRVVDLFRGVSGRPRMDTCAIAAELGLCEADVANAVARHRDSLAARRAGFGACRRSSLEASSSPERHADHLADLSHQRRVG